MKLYYVPGACSLAPHIIAREAELPIRIEKVNLATRKTETQADFLAINPKGYVPALQFNDGEVLTECATILQFIADQNPKAKLIPPVGTMDRYRVLEWLTFISTEVHKGFSPLWKPNTPPETQELAIANLHRRFAYLDRHLATHAFLMGDEFTIADAYLFTVVSWSNVHGLDLSAHPNLHAYLERVKARPKVRAALAEEGLIKEAA